MTMLMAGSEVLTFEELSRKVGPIRFTEGLWFTQAPFIVISVDTGVRYRCRAVSLEGEAVYSLKVNRVDTEDKDRNPAFWLSLSGFVLPD